MYIKTQTHTHPYKHSQTHSQIHIMAEEAGSRGYDIVSIRTFFDFVVVSAFLLETQSSVCHSPLRTSCSQLRGLVIYNTRLLCSLLLLLLCIRWEAHKQVRRKKQFFKYFPLLLLLLVLFLLLFYDSRRRCRTEKKSHSY